MEFAKTIKVRLIMTNALLGTTPLEIEGFTKFVASHAPDEETRLDEVENFEPIVSAMGIQTNFQRNNEGYPILKDYQIKGFFKDACAMLRRNPIYKSAALKAYKKIIDGMIFVSPRDIPIHVNGELSTLTRPMRSNTGRVEITAIASSEIAPAGSSIEIAIGLLDAIYEQNIIEWLDYGTLRGLCQWRNAGYGTFAWERID